MYVSISGHKVIHAEEIIAIFSTKVLRNQKNLSYIEEHPDCVSLISEEIKQPRSYVLTTSTLYESPISSATLRRRINAGDVR